MDSAIDLNYLKTHMVKIIQHKHRPSNSENTFRIYLYMGKFAPNKSLFISQGTRRIASGLINA